MGGPLSNKTAVAGLGTALTECKLFHVPAKGRSHDGSARLIDADLMQARNIVRRFLTATPLERAADLSTEFGRDVYLKLENCSPIRSFKCRGGIVAAEALTPQERRNGVVVASTGNHGQGVAFAGQLFDVDVVVVVPEQAEETKVTAMAGLGAKVVMAGAGLLEAEDEAKRLARETGALYIEDGDHAQLMAGASSVLWEMLEEQPHLDTVLVPVGGGNLLGATLLAAAMLRPSLRVIGVQSSSAPAVLLSWLAGETISAPCHTFAAGLATERPGRLALNVASALLSDMALVTDDDLRSAMVLGYETTGLPIEAAAAAGIAALVRYGSDIPGERIGIIVTGGRVSFPDLAHAFAQRDRLSKRAF